MSSQQKHHEELVSGFFNQLKEIFESSQQAIYLYLDDTHKVCNEKFSSLLGYGSPEDWAKLENPLEETVDKTSQLTVVNAYRAAMEKMVASKILIKLKTKNGQLLDASVIMVPLTFEGHLFALHFVEQTK